MSRGLKARTTKKKCKTGKARYFNELEAKIALASIQSRDSTRRPKQEKRPYWCPSCRGWHLTSQQRPVKKTAS